MSETQKPETKTWTGSCHCGKVSYEADLALSQVISCNCSMCQRAGWLLAFVGADQFRLLSGQDTLGDYQFNRHLIHHHFCTTCGIKPFARGTTGDGRQMVAINARCLEGVDLDALQVTHVDGRSA